MESNKNKYEIKKKEREEAKERERRQARMEKRKKSIMRYAVGILAIAVIGYGGFLLVQSTEPEGEDFSVSYTIQGREHIADGASHPPYNSNPPSSGSHYATPARGGFYNEPLPDERVVHNLEHGDVWIAYRPGVSEETKSALESFAGRYVVVSPRTENDGDISLVAWGRVDTFNVQDGLVDEGRIKDFIKRYDNLGPEKVRSF